MFKKLFPDKGKKINRLDFKHASLNEDTLYEFVKEVSQNLVLMEYPNEREIYSLVADEFIKMQISGKTIKSSELDIAGLPLGNLSDLGTVQAIGFAAIVFQMIFYRYKDQNLTIPALARIVRDENIAQDLLQAVQNNLGLDSKTATSFWKKTIELIAPEYEFSLGEIVPFTESRTIEFKDVKEKNIGKEVKENLVAFLNGEGGRIFFGIDDNGKVVGIEIKSDKDQLKLAELIQNICFTIIPKISPSAIEIKFLKVRGNDLKKRMFVIEVIIPKPVINALYRTEGGTVYIKTDTGRKQCSEDEIIDEEIRRGLNS